MSDDGKDDMVEREKPRKTKSPMQTVLQLVIISVFIGAVFSFFGLGPFDFWKGLFDGVRDVIAAIGDSLGEVVINLITYLVIGGAIVVPIWLIAKVLTTRR